MKHLSCHDKTQEQIGIKLANTEYMLTHVLKKINGFSCDVEITALEDLGFSNNMMRMQGGFFTGIVVKWNSAVPFIPVDTTVNSCGVSIFRFNEILDFRDFQNRIAALDVQIKELGINNNFHRGNHFISLCADSDNRQYLVIHASDASFKYGKLGLYPREDSWFYEKIRTECLANCYLRYITGDAAELFYRIYLEAEKANPIRNKVVAELILDGCSGIEEILYSPHYGMPDSFSVAIGSQWREQDSVLLTFEGSPIYILSDISKCTKFMPHGFGLSIKEDCNSFAITEQGIIINGKAYHCDNGFISCDIAKTRNSERIVNRATVHEFMPSRSIVITNELKQRFSYTRKGVHIFE